MLSPETLDRKWNLGKYFNFKIVAYTVCTGLDYYFTVNIAYRNSFGIIIDLIDYQKQSTMLRLAFLLDNCFVPDTSTPS